MAVNHRSEATFGILTFLLAGGALALPLLLGTLLVGSEVVAEAIGGTRMHEAVTDGSLYLTAMVAFMVALPLVALGTAAMMGRRAATTGNDVKGAAALTTLFGGLIAWVDLIIAMLLSAALVSDFNVVFDIVMESLVYLLIGILPLMGIAALVAALFQDAFLGGSTPAVAATGAAPVQPSPYEPTPGPSGFTYAPEPGPEDAYADPGHPGEALEEHEIDCPRCNARFAVSGERPMRIECPQCGKTGTIR